MEFDKFVVVAISRIVIRPFIFYLHPFQLAFQNVAHLPEQNCRIDMICPTKHVRLSDFLETNFGPSILSIHTHWIIFFSACNKKRWNMPKNPAFSFHIWKSTNQNLLRRINGLFHKKALLYHLSSYISLMWLKYVIGCEKMKWSPKLLSEKLNSITL